MVIHPQHQDLWFAVKELLSKAIVVST